MSGLTTVKLDQHLQSLRCSYCRRRDKDGAQLFRCLEPNCQTTYCSRECQFVNLKSHRRSYHPPDKFPLEIFELIFQRLTISFVNKIKRGIPYIYRKDDKFEEQFVFNPQTDVDFLTLMAFNRINSSIYHLTNLICIAIKIGSRFCISKQMSIDGRVVNVGTLTHIHTDPPKDTIGSFIIVPVKQKITPCIVGLVKDCNLTTFDGQVCTQQQFGHTIKLKQPNQKYLDIIQKYEETKELNSDKQSGSDKSRIKHVKRVKTQTILRQTKVHINKKTNKQRIFQPSRK